MARHDSDVSISVPYALNDTPAEVRKESLSSRGEEINCEEAPCRCLADDVLCQCPTDAALSLGWGDEYSGNYPATSQFLLGTRRIATPLNNTESK